MKIALVVGLILLIIIAIAMTASQNTPTALNLLTRTPTPEVQFGQNRTAPPTTPYEVLGEEARQEIPEVSEATIETSKGTIVVTLFPEAAPNTVTNFADKATTGFYDNLTFHRIEGWVVQGGDPSGNGTGGGQMPTELNNNPFIRGSVGVARGGNIEISNDAQFFITKTDASWLNEEYTNFGQVNEGMDVADALEIGDKILSVSIK